MASKNRGKVKRGVKKKVEQAFLPVHLPASGASRLLLPSCDRIRFMQQHLTAGVDRRQFLVTKLSADFGANHHDRHQWPRGR
jgi:hypothetical protein